MMESVEDMEELRRKAIMEIELQTINHKIDKGRQKALIEFGIGKDG